MEHRGWLVRNFLETIGVEAAGQLRARAVAGLKTMFASNYPRHLSAIAALEGVAVSGEADASSHQQDGLAGRARAGGLSSRGVSASRAFSAGAR
jgi:hypothetical protein